MTGKRIDLATKFIPDGHRVYRVFPGSDYKFYRRFKETGSVFLDMPGLDLMPGDGDKKNENQLLSKLTHSRKVRDWIVDSQDTERPSYDDPLVARPRRTPKRATFMGWIRALYFDLMPGDLVVVPPSSYLKPVLIGEILTPPNSGETVTYPRYGEEKIPCRHVRWLPHGKHKIHFSEDLISIFGTSNVIITLKTKQRREEIYRAVFPAFVFESDSVARFAFNKERIDMERFVEATNFLTYLACLFMAHEKEKLPDLLALGADFSTVRQKFYDAEMLETSVNINSPGHLSWLTNRMTLPMVVALLLRAATMGLSLDEAAAAEIINSLEAVPPQCQIEIIESFRGILEMMNIDDWQRACTKAAEAVDGSGLDSSVTIAPGDLVE